MWKLLTWSKQPWKRMASPKKRPERWGQNCVKNIHEGQGQHFWQSLFGNRPFEKGAHIVSASEKRTSNFVENPLGKGSIWCFEKPQAHKFGNIPFEKGAHIFSLWEEDQQIGWEPLGKGEKLVDALKGHKPTSPLCSWALAKGVKAICLWERAAFPKDVFIPIHPPLCVAAFFFTRWLLPKSLKDKGLPGVGGEAGLTPNSMV